MAKKVKTSPKSKQEKKSNKSASLVSKLKILASNYDSDTDEFKYQANTIEQGGVKFYTASIDSKVLAQTTFVRHREENIDEGFQRTLNRKKAEKIASYLDDEGGSIPTSIILSAQDAAEVTFRKTIRFKNIEKAFLIIDGQHRIYGYKLAKMNCRVPVVIYDGLTPEQEARLFVDINNNQDPIPQALLLDIKRFANLETGVESYLGDVFEEFYSNPESALKGLMSKTGKDQKKLNRSKFQRGLKPLIVNNIINMDSRSHTEVFDIFNSYLLALRESFIFNFDSYAVQGEFFSAICKIFPEVAAAVKEMDEGYNVKNFVSFLLIKFRSLKEDEVKKHNSSATSLEELLKKKLKVGFTL